MEELADASVRYARRDSHDMVDARRRKFKKRGLCSTGSAPVESYTTPFAVFVTAESWYGRHFASSSPPCHCITASPPAKTANEKDADAARHAAIRASARPVLP